MAEIVDLISDSDDDAPPPAPAQALPAFVTADCLVEDLSDHSEDERLLRGGAEAKPAKRARVEAPVFAAARPAAAAPRPTAAPRPAAARPALVPEAQLPIKREWFEAICYGKKRVEFREASQYWRSRLLGKAALNVRLVNGRGDAAPFCVYETTRVELLATGAIPAGLAPAPGTAAHRELFKGVDVVIALHLGRRLALRDPKTGREERYDPSRASPPPPPRARRRATSAARPARLASRGARRTRAASTTSASPATPGSAGPTTPRTRPRPSRRRRTSASAARPTRTSSAPRTRRRAAPRSGPPRATTAGPGATSSASTARRASRASSPRSTSAATRRSSRACPR